MTQKQILGLVSGVLVLGLIFVFVYRQLAAPSGGGTASSNTSVSQPVKKMPEPETIDDISQSIQGETAADLSALDDEMNGEISELEADSDSVTNLSTSYDENSL